MSPENDFNVNRVESLEQIAGLKPVGARGERKGRENAAKKHRDKKSSGSEESAEQTEQQLELNERGKNSSDDEHSIDYRA